MFQASQQRQMMSEPVVSATSQWTAEGKYKWEAGEELGSPGWDLLQLEMEGVPVREKSKEVRAGSCHPCAAGRPGTDPSEEEAAKGPGLSERGIYDHRH